jgi:serine/threonine protein kinase
MISLGTTFGRYEIRSKIGEGGMGEVYLAQDTKLDRKVALKILTAELASNRDRMERLNREAKVSGCAESPEHRAKSSGLVKTAARTTSRWSSSTCCVARKNY